MQPGLIGERFISTTNPVPKDIQRKVTSYDHDKIKFIKNPMYGRFQAPGLKWGGAKAISSSNLASVRNEKIQKLRKRGRDDSILTNAGEIPSGQLECNEQLHTQQSGVNAASQVAEGHGTQVKMNIKRNNKVQSQMPKPKPWK